MSDLLVADFSNAKIGDKVKCLTRGTGVITHINKLNNYQISVLFNREERRTTNGFKINESYTYSGFWNTKDWLPTLFYHFEGQFPTKEACTRPLPDIEVDTKVLVRPVQTKQWVEYYATGKICKLGYIEVFSLGRTEWTNKGLMGGTGSFKYWKLADDPTINSGNLEEIEG